MRIVNEDGSEAEMCGNGIRCFAKYVYERGIVDKSEFGVETLAGVMRPKLVFQGGAVSGRHRRHGRTVSGVAPRFPSSGKGAASAGS